MLFRSQSLTKAWIVPSGSASRCTACKKDTCCQAGRHSCWADDGLGSQRRPISFWHTKKSETETRMCSRTRTECGFLTSCCDSGKCHQLVTKKRFHNTGKKPGTCPGPVLNFIPVLSSCFLPPAPALFLPQSLFLLSGGW